jgi:replication factor A2
VLQSKGGNSTLRPVTIKQILDAELPHPDSDFSIEGVDVGSVSPS